VAPARARIGEFKCQVVIGAGRKELSSQQGAIYALVGNLFAMLPKYAISEK
jgi:hypothetical protein